MPPTFAAHKYLNSCACPGWPDCCKFPPHVVLPTRGRPQEDPPHGGPHFVDQRTLGISPMPVLNSKQADGGQSPRRMAPSARLSEPVLLKRARDRDVSAFEELVNRTEVKLYRVVMRIVHNESDAQEVLQDAYLSAWRSMPTFEGRAQFASWMHRIVVNTALMRLRTRNRHPEVAIQDLDLSEVNEAIGQARQTALWRENPPDRPDEQLQSAELLRQIETAVNHLPHNLRAIFLLRAVGEVSTQDSAARLGVSIPTAKTRLNRARRVLRASLGDYVAC